MIAICNTRPISNLIQIDALPSLRRLFAQITIPPEVVGELDAGSEDLGAWREAPGAAAAERRALQSRTHPIRGEISQLRYLAKKTSGKA